MSKAGPEAPGPPIEEATWLALVREVSHDGRYFFTEQQLYLAYARNKVIVTRFVARRGVFGLCLIALGLATWVYALKADWGITLVLGIAATLSGVAMVGTGVVTRRDPARREPLAEWLERGIPLVDADRLIRRPTLAHVGLEYRPADVQCLIIVERETLVDLLLKNGAQEALAALIVSESGYPSALAREARQKLESQSQLKVVALHDATPTGVAMAARLQNNALFPGACRALLDAGLFPADVTWLAELAPAIPASHRNSVPVDSLCYQTLLSGLDGVLKGAVSLYAAIDHTAHVNVRTDDAVPVHEHAPEAVSKST